MTTTYVHPMTLREVMQAEERLPTCPKCGAEDSMEHVKTEVGNIETHYDVCVVCDYRTAPE